MPGTQSLLILLLWPEDIQAHFDLKDFDSGEFGFFLGTKNFLTLPETSDLLAVWP